MKKSVLIFAKTDASKTPYDLWLKDTDVEPILIVPTEVASSYRHLQNVYAFDNYDKNQLVEKKAYEIAATINLVGVFARGEADVLRAAQLRDQFGIQGQSELSARAYRHKLVMKDYLKSAGTVRLPVYEKIRSAYDVLNFIEAHGLPVVIKPVMESGSFGTHIITTADELKQYFLNPHIGECEIETYIKGQMFHVDGLILGGELRFIQPFQYLNTCLSFRKNEHAGSSTMSSDHPKYFALIEEAKKVISILPSAQNMAFHAEFWIDENGQSTFCEIASRTGGALTSSILQYSSGINFDEEWFRRECGFKREIKISKFRFGGGVILPPQNGILKAYPQAAMPDYIQMSQYCGAEGQRYYGGVKSGLFLAGYIVGGESEHAVRQNMSLAADWFTENAKWEIHS